MAYISFEHFDDRPEALAALHRFLSDYASARALIIDSRGNHGGAFDMLGLISNHLFGRAQLLANMDMATSVVTQHGAPFPVDGATLKQVKGPAGMTRLQHWAVPSPDAGNWPRMPSTPNFPSIVLSSRAYGDGPERDHARDAHR